MEIQWFEVIQSLLYVIVMVAVPVVVKFIREKNKTEQFAKVLEYARIAVEFAEKYYYAYEGEVKYKHASQWLAERAAEIGIKLTDEEIRGLIESTLKRIEMEFGEAWGNSKKEEIVEDGLA